MPSKEDIEADNTTGYQSSAFHDDMHNVDIDYNPTDPQDDNEPKGYNPGQSAHVHTNAFASDLEELLPQSMNNFNFFEALIPKMSRYIGTNLLVFYYILAYIGGIVGTIALVLSLIINSFMVHWALGIFSLLYSVVLGVLGFIMYIVVLRLFVEFLMSVFVIRERLTRLSAAQKSQ